MKENEHHVSCLESTMEHFSAYLSKLLPSTNPILLFTWNQFPCFVSKCSNQTTNRRCSEKYCCQSFTSPGKLVSLQTHVCCNVGCVLFIFYFSLAVTPVTKSGLYSLTCDTAVSTQPNHPFWLKRWYEFLSLVRCAAIDSAVVKFYLKWMKLQTINIIKYSAHGANTDKCEGHMDYAIVPRTGPRMKEN